MATNLEVQVDQKKRLYMLLRLKKVYGANSAKEHEEMIISTKAEMQQEDVAWVEKNIAELQ